MQQINETLYGKDSSGSLKVWTVFTEGNKIVVHFGKLGGKIQTKDTLCKGKNIGRSNETSPEQQAILEAKAKWVKQCKKGYYTSKDAALAHEEFTPMKAQNYKDFADRVVYPCYVQPKLNGLRCLSTDEQELMSKAGEPYKLPAHWLEDFNNLPEIPVDGEVFAGYQKQGGMSLQQINSAWKKPNINTPRLKYYIYDIPVSGVEWADRLTMLMDLSKKTFKNIIVVEGKWCNTQEELDKFYEDCLLAGAEGIVCRNADGLYEFGKRSYSLIKRKPREDMEALVISSEEDKNGQGNLTCVLQNGVEFECLMRKDSHDTINYRLYENSLKLIGTHIKFEYEEFSDNGVPTKPVGVGLRNVDPLTWKVLE